MLEVIRGNTDSPSCQHVLIVGPRGRGKTMLLARVGAELRTDNALSSVCFRYGSWKESQEIATLADFWLEALFHLARANATGNPEFSRELLATHADLTARWRDTNIRGVYSGCLSGGGGSPGPKVVLMVENLQSLCSDVDDDFGWQLRQTLQSEPRLMLLATATSRFRGLDDANRPFFELFRIVELEPLSTDACRRLWNMVSGDKQTSREIKPLRILTGGSPRLLGHRRDVCTASIAAPAHGRTGDAGRRPHRVLPQPSGGPCQDRASRLSRGHRPLAIVERPRDRGASAHGHSHRIGADRAAGRPGRSCRGRDRAGSGSTPPRNVSTASTTSCDANATRPGWCATSSSS